jgi:DNA-binding Xre family transcriptional regulator
MTVATCEPLKSSNPGKARKMSRRTNLMGKEVRGMNDETTERSRRVAAIKETAESTNNGRSYLLKGLWACRLAAGLNQRQLAEAIGSSQATVGQLERGDRGAYPRTIVRLCECLGVAPEDLLSGDDSPSEPKKSVDRIRR